MTETVVAAPLALVLHWKDAAGNGAAGPLASLDLRWAAGLAGRYPAPQPALRLSERGRILGAALADYVQGRAAAWPEVDVDMEPLSKFSRTVLTTLRNEVPAGATVSYGALAALCGQPGAARAVGRAMATNPWPLLYPCHRVLGASGALTGFGPGVEMKRYLLELEGVPLRS
jgi:methylated-DNA-[protein]-cysteine S-methyltransferase